MARGVLVSRSRLMSVRTPKLLAWLVAAFVVVALPRVAMAQTVALTQGAVVQDQFPDGSSSGHPNNVNATWISHQDCVNNINVVIPLTLAPPTGGSFSGYQLQAWASSQADCTQPTNRGTTTGLCWQVYPSNIQPNLSLTVPIRAQDLVRYLGTSTAGINPAYPNADSTACNQIQTSGAVPVNLQFIWFQGPTAGNAASIPLNVEMIGPAPPTNFTVGQGDTLLILNWTPVNDPNTRGFSIFIDPLPGQEFGQDGGQDASQDTGAMAGDSGPQFTLVCADAGFTEGGVDDSGDAIAPQPIDGGCILENLNDSGSTQLPNGTCNSSILVTGVTSTSTTSTPAQTSEGGVTSEAGTTTVVTGTAPSSAALAHKIIDIGDGTATHATIGGLVNGVQYTVAIAAVDNLADNGPLGTPHCTDPTPILDFWGQYRGAGGAAGGGFCALEGVGMPAGVSVFAMGMLGIAMAWIRRRRRR
jgi:MYXO-CTERM domain-containing protein